MFDSHAHGQHLRGRLGFLEICPPPPIVWLRFLMARASQEWILQYAKDIAKSGKFRCGSDSLNRRQNNSSNWHQANS
jgi:hypothetical protein